MSTTPPRQRRRDRVAEAYSPGAMEDDAPGTPGPTRARINNLEGQVQELVRKLHAAERKVVAESKEHEHAMEELQNDRALLRFQLERESKSSTGLKNEVVRCREQGRIMREELSQYIKLQEQKAAVAAVNEELALIERERSSRLADAERLMRDHKLLLFQSREADLLADGDDKDARIAQLEEELESANTSMAHQRAAEDKAKAMVSSQDETRAEVSELQSKIAELEKNNRRLQEKEKSTRSELETLLEEKDKSGSVDRETGELRSQLRTAKKEAREQTQKAEEAKEALDEYKERMDAKHARLKEKAKALQADSVKLAEVESELAELRSSKSVVSMPKATKTKKAVTTSPSPSPSPVKAKAKSKETTVSKPRSRKTSPTESEDDAPKKKAKAEKKPLRETASVNLKSAVEDEPPAKEAVPADKKKKRRILGGAAPAAFTWDPIMNSGDGVIPTFLSPVRPGGKSVGTVPRAGFGSLGSRGR